MENTVLGKKLKELRKIHGYNQTMVADTVGIARQTYANYEAGIRTPGYDIMYKLAGLYQISMDDLMQLVTEPDPEEFFALPPSTQSAQDIADFLEYFNDPVHQKRFRNFSNLEKELFYYFEKIPKEDQEEVVEITKIKVRKKAKSFS